MKKLNPASMFNKSISLDSPSLKLTNSILVYEGWDITSYVSDAVNVMLQLHKPSNLLFQNRLTTLNNNNSIKHHNNHNFYWKNQNISTYLRNSVHLCLSFLDNVSES